MKKVLIANRGEIACRIIRTCKNIGFSTVAVYSEADENSQHVLLADEAYLIGPPPVQESYLNSKKIIEIAKRSKANLLHPGYGLLAENEEFANDVETSGLTWVGPSPSTIAVMGDKGKAREIARQSNVPVLPGSPSITSSDFDSLPELSKRLELPLLVKATGGGGGIGMRRVSDTARLYETAKSVSDLAERLFGDASIFLEHHVENARHIEVQVFGLGDGRVFHLGDRECSVQRRFQKVIEEAPAPNILASVRSEMADSACRLAASQNYSGAGTVEFILDVKNNSFYFLEMNTRIQVEHPTTEMISKQDIVYLQLMQAIGKIPEYLMDNPPYLSGHSIECRLYAEKPERNFIPSPGQLRVLRFPCPSNFIRIETGYIEGDKITPFYDPMIAKIITFAQDRDEAIQKMRSVLEECQIDGISTNLTLLKNILKDPLFEKAKVNTTYLEQNKATLLGSI